MHFSRHSKLTRLLGARAAAAAAPPDGPNQSQAGASALVPIVRRLFAPSHIPPIPSAGLRIHAGAEHRPHGDDLHCARALRRAAQGRRPRHRLGTSTPLPLMPPRSPHSGTHPICPQTLQREP